MKQAYTLTLTDSGHNGVGHKHIKICIKQKQNMKINTEIEKMCFFGTESQTQISSVKMCADFHYRLDKMGNFFTRISYFVK